MGGTRDISEGCILLSHFDFDRKTTIGVVGFVVPVANSISCLLLFVCLLVS